MSKFIRSAFFPILVVIVLAVVVQWVLKSGGTSTPKYVYAGVTTVKGVPTAPAAQLSADLAAGKVQRVVYDSQTLAALVTTTASAGTGSTASSSAPTATPSPSTSTSTAPVSGPPSSYGVVFGYSDRSSFDQLLKTLARDKVTSVVGAVPTTNAPNTPPSFVNDLQNGRVQQVVMNTKDQTLQVTQTAAGGGLKYKVTYPDTTGQTTSDLVAQYNVQLIPQNPGSPWWGGLISLLLPFVLIIGFWIFIMNQMQGGGSKVMSFGKSRAKRVSVDSPKVTFKDVAGVDETVEELQEIKEFLENPKKFQQLGARIPKGVLLYGPPGTGKTLLARAVAGEAGVPFFSHLGLRLRRDVRRRRRRAACATCSTRPSRTRPASSSWTRSTPWAATAAPAWAAVTTSASRP